MCKIKYLFLVIIGLNALSCMSVQPASSDDYKDGQAVAYKERKGNYFTPL